MGSLDTRKLVQRFGGPTQLHKRLTREGYVISLRAIHQWVRRGSVPSSWLQILLMLAETDGRPLSLRDYCKSMGCDDDLSFLD